MRIQWALGTILTLSAAAVFSTSAQQQPEAPKRRPKIGIALEGGGALGLAHVGVLDWFEKNHIPVDYIAGTSMGGLVGGLYATGKSASDLKKMIGSLDWNDFLAGQVSYTDLSYRRKEDLHAYPNSLELGWRRGPQLPAALNSGHQITLLLDRETLPYSSLKSFDDLPIPFRCVSADLITGLKHVFKDGQLGEAMRATMAVPGQFTPVRQNGAVYVDGGIVDNLPTDVVKQMGADIVIAVHLGRGPVNPNTLHSVVGVLLRAGEVPIDANVIKGLESADVVITVDVSGYTTSDYGKSSKIIEKGEIAAEDKLKVLSMLRLNDADWQEHIAERNARRIASTPIPQFVAVEGSTQQANKAIEKLLAPLAGHPLDVDKVENSVTRLVGTGRYTRVGYSLTNREGQEGLLIQAEDRDGGHATIQPGFELDGSDTSNIQFTLGTRLTIRDLGAFRSEWRTDFSFGSINSIQSEYILPLGTYSRWFIAPRAGVSGTSLNIYLHDKILSQYHENQTDVGLDMIYAINRFSELRAGYQTGTFSAAERVGPQVIPSVSGRVGFSRGRFSLDHLNDPVIPTRGYAFNVDFEWYDKNPGSIREFPASEAHFQVFQPVSSKSSLYFTASGGSTFGRTNTGFPLFSLGGPNLLSAYGLNEILGNQYFLARAGYLRELVQFSPLLGKALYLDVSYEAGKMYGVTTSSRLPNDFTAGIVAQTLLGPVFMGGSVGDTGHRKFFVQLGRVF